MGSRGLVVVVLLFLSRWGSPARRAALLGAAAALVWAIDAAVVKAATEVLAHHGWGGLFLHWPVYGVVVTGVLGTILLESAFAVGPLAASQSALLIVDPLASIAIGIELFGEQLRNSPGAIALEVLFLIAMAAGVILLSKWAPPEMEARAKRSPRSGDNRRAGSGSDLTSWVSDPVRLPDEPGRGSEFDPANHQQTSDDRRGPGDEPQVDGTDGLFRGRDDRMRVVGHLGLFGHDSIMPIFRPTQSSVSSVPPPGGLSGRGAPLASSGKDRRRRSLRGNQCSLGH